MQQLIIGYLFQHGYCNLPGIGKFSLQHIPANYDITLKLMNPPIQKVIFEESPSIMVGNLIEAISLKNAVTKDAARNLLDHFCNEIKDNLEKDVPVEFETIGSLNKSPDGKIIFNSTDTSLFTPVLSAERIQNADYSHEILVGDHVVNLDDHGVVERKLKTPGRRTWLTLTIIAAILSILIIVIHFYNNPFSPTSIGNSQKVKIADPPKTHE